LKRLRLMNWKLAQLLAERTGLDNNKTRTMAHNRRVLEADWKVQASHQKSAITRIEQQVNSISQALTKLNEHVSMVSEPEKKAFASSRAEQEKELKALFDSRKSLVEKHNLFLTKKTEYFAHFLQQRQKKWENLYNKKQREINTLKEMVSKTLKEIGYDEGKSLTAPSVLDKEQQLTDLKAAFEVHQQQFLELRQKYKEKEAEVSDLKAAMTVQKQQMKSQNQKLLGDILQRKHEYENKENTWRQEKISFEVLILELEKSKSEQQTLLRDRCNSVSAINSELKTLQDRLAVVPGKSNTADDTDSTESPSLTVVSSSSPTIVKNLAKALENVLTDADSNVVDEVNQFVFTVDWMVQENDKLQKKLKTSRRESKQTTSALVQEKKKLTAQVLQLQEQLQQKEESLQAQGPD